MANRLTLDKAGRIVLPKPLRDELQLAPGDILEIESAGDHITMRPVRGNGQLQKRDGLWVFHSGEPITAEMAERTAREVRRERERQIWGEDS